MKAAVAVSRILRIIYIFFFFLFSKDRGKTKQKPSNAKYVHIKKYRFPKAKDNHFENAIDFVWERFLCKWLNPDDDRFAGRAPVKSKCVGFAAHFAQWFPLLYIMQKSFTGVASTSSNKHNITKHLTLSHVLMGKWTVSGRWGLRHLNFVFICRMATRLRMKLRIKLFFTVIKSFWGVHVQVLAQIFAQRWAVSLSQRLVAEAIGMQRQPWSKWTFLTKRNRLTTLEWSPTTMTVPFRFHVMVGLKLAAQRARAKQNRAMGSPWRWGWRSWWSGVRSWRCT